MNLLETLQSAFIERAGPFAKGVVRAQDVAEYARRKTGFNLSATAAGKLLGQPPFNGVHYQFRAGGGIRRAIVLDSRWLGAPGKDIWAYLTSDYNDPLCE